MRIKKKDIFFETLENMADSLVQAADYFAEQVASLKDIPQFTKMMKDYENQCDTYTHTIITELNKTFITPLERDDIMELTTKMDDVMDGLEACASRFEMYHLNKPDQYINAFAEILRECAYEIQKAIQLLSQKKLLPIREHSIRLNDLENQGDDIMRKCITELFATVTDPIELIKRKEIYERLENTTDSCEDVANTLESIIMSNS
ncbi:DUF47 domain-containing protein [Paenibacillus wulumuqiensis]|uniref:DUF47 domain-containing protein n=1 Tax=Paenibacillus wulumuqiensis TaxID=1567107 RepID=UPI0006193FBC|nr:DUF47 family protein [Paenibacillus wulumuqiensis]